MIWGLCYFKNGVYIFFKNISKGYLKKKKKAPIEKLIERSMVLASWHLTDVSVLQIKGEHVRLLGLGSAVFCVLSF